MCESMSVIYQVIVCFFATYPTARLGGRPVKKMSVFKPSRRTCVSAYSSLQFPTE